MEPLPVCQSCGMPLENKEDRGTNSNKSKSDDYCKYCFQGGEFTEDLNMDQMIGKVAGFLDDYTTMPREAAKEFAKRNIPYLKRWNKENK